MTKFNMNPIKVSMPEQEPLVRAKNFLEVTLGYTKEMAMEEAKRCLQCKNPKCVGACPVNIKIPNFIAQVAKGNIEEAYKIISEDTLFPSICGRVCPQETQCEEKCVVGIKNEPVGIGRLERFAADYHMKNAEEKIPHINKNNIKVAIIGAGPAGLSCASELGKLGYDVTIFEALHVPGGVLLYGIPEFRLPKRIVEKEELEKLIKQLELANNKTIKIEENEEYLVFGSFLVVEKFLSLIGYNESL